MTSHDVVALVRRVTSIKRVGHTGTLDPAAAGVLPVCIGHATRLVEYLQAGSKEYVAEATFGYETDTLDAVGQVVREADASQVTLESLRWALDAFRGTIRQTPPLYSAIKQGGQKLYEIARAGAEVDEASLQAREVTIDRLLVSRFVAATDAARPRAMLHVTCSGGTYIRSLVRDFGRALGCGATMTFLVRTRSGAFLLQEAATLEQIQTDVNANLLPLSDALRLCADSVVIDDQAAHHLAQGRTTTSSQAQGDGVDGSRVLFLNTAGTVAALATPMPSSPAICYKAEKVFYLD
ncbi:MAG: tRNA pseudouridine(55) synthase TruB [Armatimonadota bacterium]|nr:tRNA pseudouridine(55) synthase TruB [Armatimonadota bacterium]